MIICTMSCPTKKSLLRSSLQALQRSFTPLLVALQLVPVADLDLNRVPEELCGQPPDAHRPRGRKEHRVAVRVGDPKRFLDPKRLIFPRRFTKIFRI